MEIQYTHCKRLIIFPVVLMFFGLLCLTVSCRKEGTSETAAGQITSGKLSLNDQEKLAKKLYSQMVKTDEFETETFLKLHAQVIEQCPDTDYAPESLWRLSNLYLTGLSDSPNHPKIAELMEKLISQYPESEWVPGAKRRLQVSYEDMKEFTKLLPLLEEEISAEPGFMDNPENAAVLLDYAKALDKTGNREKAKEILTRVLGWKEKLEDWLIGIAQDELDYLAGKKANIISPEDALKVVTDLPEVKILEKQYAEKGLKLEFRVIGQPELKEGRWIPEFYTVAAGWEEEGEFVKAFRKDEAVSFQIDCFNKKILWVLTEDVMNPSITLEEWQRQFIK
jgi:tetratricopeptide (TPR) repeat protein